MTVDVESAHAHGGDGLLGAGLADQLAAHDGGAVLDRRLDVSAQKVGKLVERLGRVVPRPGAGMRAASEGESLSESIQRQGIAVNREQSVIAKRDLAG